MAQSEMFENIRDALIDFLNEKRGRKSPSSPSYFSALAERLGLEAHAAHTAAHAAHVRHTAASFVV